MFNRLILLLYLFLYLSFFPPIIFKEYSTQLIYFFISFKISTSISLSFFFSFASPSYSFISLSPPLFTLHSHSIVKHSNIIQVVAGGLQSNITTTHNTTGHTQRPLPLPFSTNAPFPLLPCVSLSIKRNLVLISCLLLLLKFIEPILIFYLLQHAHNMEGQKGRGEGGQQQSRDN